MTSEPEKHWLPPALGAMSVWGLWAFLPKVALQKMHPHSVIFYESLGNLCISLPVLVFILKFRLQREKFGIAVVGSSSVLTVCAIISYFFALQNGPVAVIVTMTAMYPVICLILARIFLNERINKTQLVAVIMAMASILLLAMG
jgi:transporter family protein